MGKKKILFAVGGTGGHLFPAQALARNLKEEHEVFFGGGRLSTNPFFDREQFPHREVRGGSPFRGNPLKAIFELSLGVGTSLKLLSDFDPDLLIGFGSFYSFPLLVAARMKKVPYLLVESNVLPGKVNRLFASKAAFSAIQFEEAAHHLKGQSALAKMPLWSQEEKAVSVAEARQAFGLNPDLFTLLVLGGSQGAEAINQAVASLSLDFPYQVLHLSGKDGDLEERYAAKKIPACVKPFEERMHLAWRAASLAVCRAGAGTLTEALAFEVPAILIPWPGASEDHQMKNARAFAKSGGARVLKEENLSLLGSEVGAAFKDTEGMKANLNRLNTSSAIEPLSHIVKKYIGEST